MGVSSRRIIFTLTVVICCFGVLGPKVFYPMLQNSMLSLNDRIDGDYASNIEVLSRMKELMGEERPIEHIDHRGGNSRMFAHPALQWMPLVQPKGNGTIGFAMFFYTIAIVIFFLYTIIKLIFNKSGEKISCRNKTCLNCNCCKTSKALSKQGNTTSKNGEIIQNNRTTKQFLENYGKDKVREALKYLIAEMTNTNESLAIRKYGTEEKCCKNWKIL